MLAFRAQKELGAQIFVVWRYVLGLLGFGVYYMLPDQKTSAIDSILRSSWKSTWKYGKILVFGKKSNDWLGDSACINTLSSSGTIRLGYGNIRQHFPNRFWSKKQWKYVFLGKLELWVLDLVTSILVYFKTNQSGSERREGALTSRKDNLALLIPNLFHGIQPILDYIQSDDWR